jgi:hypothetical protein
MKLGEVRKRAKALGIDPAELEKVIDEASDPKDAIVQMILAASRTAAVAAAEKDDEGFADAFGEAGSAGEGETSVSAQRVTLEGEGKGFSLFTNEAGRLTVKEVTPDSSNADALAKIGPGYELREVGGLSVVGMAFDEVSRLPEWRERPLTLGFALPGAHSGDLPHPPPHTPPQPQTKTTYTHGERLFEAATKAARAARGGAAAAPPKRLGPPPLARCPKCEATFSESAGESHSDDCPNRS